MSFQGGVCLTLEAHHVADSGVIRVTVKDTFDCLETNMDGLREFLRNIDTAHIQCSVFCAKELYKSNFNSGRVFLYREFPKSLKVDEDTLSGCIYIESEDRVCVYLRKSLNLPYDNLITNFKISNT